MATLVLTAVGTAIGGPLGGALGAMIGRQVDATLLGGPARQGSRLKELAVQTSSYGTQVPAVFGAMRVAGTVIWSTDLIEDKHKSGGGKGRPASVNYSYRVSMAIALSSRPIARIGRVWADGNLIRGAAGDVKVNTQFRYHTGHRDQAPDPLMASAEAAGQCPAYRGIAYAVFEDLQLADFGNRIPSLTFELFERDGPVSVADIMTCISGDTIASDAHHLVTGFAASGDSLGEAVAPLLEAFPVQMVARGKNLDVRDVVMPAAELPLLTIAARANEQELDRPKRAITSGSHIPSTISIRYYDAERDYQAGIQHSSGRSTGRREIRVELPAVLNAPAARRLVDIKDHDARFTRKTWSGSVLRPLRALLPGDCFRMDDGSIWQIDEIEEGLGTLTLKAKAATTPCAPYSVIGTPGRHIPSSDEQIGETQLMIVDAPIFEGRDPGRPNVLVFAAGNAAGWRRAMLSLNFAGELTEIGETAPRSIMGITRNNLPGHHPFLCDEHSHLDIELLHNGMSIAERDVSPVAPDAPLFWLNGEFLRVGKITATGSNHYRLSRFIRSCFSGEPTESAHAEGSKIVLVDPGTARAIAEHNYAIGQTIYVEGQGIGDTDPAESALVVSGRAIQPTSPVHGTAIWLPDGSMNVHWVRRSRLDLGWVDGVDQAMAEDKESYIVALKSAETVINAWEVSTTELHISAAECASLSISANSALLMSVRQSGRFAQSAPLTVRIP